MGRRSRGGRPEDPQMYGGARETDKPAASFAGAAAVTGPADGRLVPGLVNVYTSEFRPHRVGSTQSNMSMPAATAATMSLGCPTPIR